MIACHGRCTCSLLCPNHTLPQPCRGLHSQAQKDTMNMHLRHCMWSGKRNSSTFPPQSCNSKKHLFRNRHRKTRCTQNTWRGGSNRWAYMRRQWHSTHNHRHCYCSRRRKGRRSRHWWPCRLEWWSSDKTRTRQNSNRGCPLRSRHWMNHCRLNIRRGDWNKMVCM